MDISFHSGDVDQLRPNAADDSQVKTCSRIRREMQAEVAEEWWSSNWKTIEEAFLIAFTETDMPPCGCSSDIITLIMVVDFDCKCHCLEEGVYKLT